MRGFFCYHQPCSTDEFRKVLKVRCCLYGGIAAVGCFTFAAVLWAVFHDISMAEYTRGFLLGAGAGTMGGGLGSFLRIRRIMKHEDLLKEERLRCTDEREKAVSDRAFKCAGGAALAAAYVTALYGALFNQELVLPMLFVMCVFMLAYAAAGKFFQRKM